MDNLKRSTLPTFLIHPVESESWRDKLYTQELGLFKTVSISCIIVSDTRQTLSPVFARCFVAVVTYSSYSFLLFSIRCHRAPLRNS